MLMEKVLQAFTTRDLRVFKRIIDHLGSKNRTVSEALEFIETIEAVKKPELPPCPKCNGKLVPTAGNDRGGEAVWECKKCKYSKYDGRTLKKLRNELLKMERAPKLRINKVVPSFTKAMRIRPSNCPKCGSRLMVRSLNTPKGPSNLNGFKTHMFCSGESCLYEEYSTIPLRRYLSERVKS